MQWRFPWELLASSGTSAINLTGGDYPVEFRGVPGYLLFRWLVIAGHQWADNGGDQSVLSTFRLGPRPPVH